MQFAPAALLALGRSFSSSQLSKDNKRQAKTDYQKELLSSGPELISYLRDNFADPDCKVTSPTHITSATSTLQRSMRTVHAQRNTHQQSHQPWRLQDVYKTCLQLCCSGGGTQQSAEAVQLQRLAFSLIKAFLVCCTTSSPAPATRDVEAYLAATKSELSNLTGSHLIKVGRMG
jgi:hypothetical protein